MDIVNKMTVTVDLRQTTHVPLPQFIQDDTNILEFVIKDNGQDADLTNIGRVVVNYKRPVDNVVITRLLEIGQTSISYQIGVDEMKNVGLGELEIQFFSSDNLSRISTKRMKVSILSSIGTPDATPGGDDLTALQDLFIEVSTVKDDANTAADNANTQAAYAKAQGDYAKTQGQNAQTKWLAPVATFSAIATTYPSPSLGNTVQCLDNGFVYRFDGSQWQYTQGYSATAIADLNSQLSQTASQIVTLHHGLNVINTDQASPTDVRFFGRTLVNLLGNDGNFEKDSNGDGVTDGWSSNLFGSTASLQTDSAKYGSRAQRITSTTSDTNQYRYLFRGNIQITSDKYYLIIGDLLTDGVAQGIMSFRNSDDLSVLAENSSAASKTLYKKYACTSDLTAEIRIYNAIAKGSVGWVQFDSVRIYEIPQSIYDKIDVDPVYTGDKLAEKFPYVDSVQHVMNPYMKPSGKNLIPPYTSGKWTLHANAKVLGDYELELDATALNQESFIVLPALPNQSYYFGGTLQGQVYVRFRDSNKTSLQQTNVINVAVTSPPNTADVVIGFVNSQASTGTFTLTSPQLELGSTATPFEPQNESYLYVAQNTDKVPITLASNNDGSVADEVYQRDGQWYRLNRFKRNVVLDGSLGWIFSMDYTGYKQVFAHIASPAVTNSGIQSKYDGKIIPIGTFNTGDQSNGINANSDFTVSIFDIDSGWGESYLPSNVEVQAYFFGWRMNNGTYGTHYTGVTGDVKTWAPLGDTDNTRATTTLPAADAPTIVEGKIDHYKLTYQLAQAVEEPIEVEGSLNLIDGGNQVEVGEVVIVREKVTPSLYSGTYYINGYNQSVDGLKNRANKILVIFKNGQIDKSWGIITRSSINSVYGWDYATTAQANFDSEAVYTVTYVALDTYKLSSAENDVDVSYNTNIKTVVDQLTQRQSDDESNISVLKLQMIDAIARLQAGGL